MKNRIDNTGHILWPAEEILAYLLKVFYESKLSKYNRVIELGSGYNGLAGIMWSKLVEFTYKKAQLEANCDNKIDLEEQFLAITDGNNQCVNDLWTNYTNNLPIPNDQYVNTQCEINKEVNTNFHGNNFVCKTKQFMFNDYEIFMKDECQNKQFDFIMMADVLFFRDFHFDLLNAIENLQQKDGLCWIVGPERDGTQALFEQKLQASKKFQYAKKNCKDLLASQQNSLVNSYTIELINNITNDIYLLEIKHS